MRFFYRILVFLLLMGCQWNNNSELIAPELMQDVLREMHLADAYVETLASPLGVRNETRDEIYDIILRNRNLSRTRFYESYDYYLTHPEELNEIYQSLINDLDSLMRKGELERFNPSKKLPGRPDTTLPTH